MNLKNIIDKICIDYNISMSDIEHKLKKSQLRPGDLNSRVRNNFVSYDIVCELSEKFNKSCKISDFIDNFLTVDANRFYKEPVVVIKNGKRSYLFPSCIIEEFYFPNGSKKYNDYITRIDDGILEKYLRLVYRMVDNKVIYLNKLVDYFNKIKRDKPNIENVLEKIRSIIFKNLGFDRNFKKSSNDEIPIEEIPYLIIDIDNDVMMLDGKRYSNTNNCVANCEVEKEVAVNTSVDEHTKLKINEIANFASEHSVYIVNHYEKLLNDKIREYKELLDQEKVKYNNTVIEYDKVREMVDRNLECLEDKWKESIAENDKLKNINDKNEFNYESKIRDYEIELSKSLMNNKIKDEEINSCNLRINELERQLNDSRRTIIGLEHELELKSDLNKDAHFQPNNNIFSIIDEI